MFDYCYVPPMTGQVVKPNVLFVMDFSGSMQFPAYVPCNFNGYSQNVATCGSINVTQQSSWRYDPQRDYSGYFDPQKCYEYTGGYFQEKNCNCPNRIGTASCISGNLLNWITTTRIDIARLVLTGGKSSSSGGNTFLDSEGAIYTIDEPSLGCAFVITGTQSDYRRLTIRNLGSALCPLGNNIINNARLRIRASDPSSIRGIIHSFCDTTDLNGQINEKCQLIMEFMVFAGDNRFGEIRVGKTATISSLISAINNELPYGGTPTGEALWEAYDFYLQHNQNNFEANSAYINRRNGNVDLYYDGSGGNATPIPCRKGFVLLLSDGAWNGAVDPVIPARVMATTDLRADLPGIQRVHTYVVYAYGDEDPDTRLQGRQAMITTAIFGGFEDRDNNRFPYPFINIQYPSGSGTCSNLDGTLRVNIQTANTTYCNSRGVSYPLSVCNATGVWHQGCSEWDTAQGSPRDGTPHNFFEANDAQSLKKSLLEALYDILRRASAGATVVTLSQEGRTGSFLLQPYFFPKLISSAGEVSWIGSLRAFWLDAKARIREDALTRYILDLLTDLWLIFVPSSPEPMVFKITNETTCEHQRFEVFDPIPIFDVGCLLAERDPDTRLILANFNGTLAELASNGYRPLLTTLWNTTANAFRLPQINSNTASCIVDYLYGKNLTNCPGGDNTYINRLRTVDLNSLCRLVTNTRVWKLGDIIYSNPIVVSNLYYELETYHLIHHNETYQSYTNSSIYRQRNSYVIVGANDGMIHAFRIGWLKSQSTETQPLRLIDAFNRETYDLIGREEWAFIPYNALPYLVSYGRGDWCHIFTTDFKIYAFDAPIGGRWRTLLLGTMGFGGNPLTLGLLGNFSSSIFLLDLTDWLNGNSERPSLLWERVLPDSTLTLSIPLVIKRHNNWQIVIGSGPLSVSGGGTMTRVQYPVTPKLFFFSLNGTLLQEVRIPGVLNQAVGGLSAIDINRDYNHDFLYFGTYNHTSGQIYRVDLRGSSLLIQPINTNPLIRAPVFSAPALTLDNNDQVWVIFGTGTYFGNDLTLSFPNYLVGIKDICATNNTCGMSVYNLEDKTNFCNNPTNYSSVLLQNTTQATCEYDSINGTIVKRDRGIEMGYIYPEVNHGWFHQLMRQNERIFSNPLIFRERVFALSFTPVLDVCAVGGNTYYWDVCYESGCPCRRVGMENPEPSRYLAPGAPPLGKAFQVVKTEAAGVFIFTQTSASGGPTGIAIEAPSSRNLKGYFLLWIEK
ncbi:MAG: PilC/PilY family type IV pilus protein [Caldimicrobium sp.]|nr:PilC/PilY family type IV pilus protein [Caldimicrobium sp.]MCX7872883.1 PilC/PilY family type IV pilus protein [Caldimicrobium sp.]MDW8093539.1 PilC/PilY family type IV pilus protein [Caldimicrobium sp.]